MGCSNHQHAQLSKYYFYGKIRRTRELHRSRGTRWRRSPSSFAAQGGKCSESPLGHRGRRMPGKSFCGENYTRIKAQRCESPLRHSCAYSLLILRLRRLEYPVVSSKEGDMVQ